MLKNLLRESFLYFLKKASKTAGNGNPEKILILEETELSYISGNGTFLYFRKCNFLIFLERHIQNPSKFRTRSIFRTLTYLELEAYPEPW